MKMDRDLKRRISDIERSFGPAHQMKILHKDLLAFQTRTEQWFDRIDGRCGKIGSRLDLIEREFRGLRADIPKIVRKAARDILGSKPRSSRRMG